MESVIRRHQTGIWFARVFVIMPDHVHGLFRFPNPQYPLRKAILDFKRWTARQGKFQWQCDFFDHRLRRDESVKEKADYILMNPVRGGLTQTPEQWLHRFIATDALG